MDISYECSTCGLAHPVYEVYRDGHGCPYAGTSPEVLARLRAKAAAKKLAETSAAKAAQHRVALAQLEGKRDAQAAEDAQTAQARRWAKTSVLVQDVLAAYHAQRAEATMTEARDLLAPIRYAEDYELRDRVRWWRSKQ